MYLAGIKRRNHNYLYIRKSGHFANTVNSVFGPKLNSAFHQLKKALRIEDVMKNVTDAHKENLLPDAGATNDVISSSKAGDLHWVAPSSNLRRNTN